MKKPEKEIKTINKNFHYVNTQLAQLKENNSDISDSDTEEEYNFQHAESNVRRNKFQFEQLNTEF